MHFYINAFYNLKHWRPKSNLPSTITGGSKCISCLDLPKLGKSCHAKGFVAWTAKICKTFRSSEIR